MHSRAGFRRKRHTSQALHAIRNQVRCVYGNRPYLLYDTLTPCMKRGLLVLT